MVWGTMGMLKITLLVSLFIFILIFIGIYFIEGKPDFEKRVSQCIDSDERTSAIRTKKWLLAQSANQPVREAIEREKKKIIRDLDKVLKNLEDSEMAVLLTPEDFQKYMRNRRIVNKGMTNNLKKAKQEAKEIRIITEEVRTKSDKRTRSELGRISALSNSSYCVEIKYKKPFQSYSETIKYWSRSKIFSEDKSYWDKLFIKKYGAKAF